MTNPTALMLTTAGEWVTLDSDPVGPDLGAGWDEEVKKAGYYSWGGVSRAETTPMWVDVYRARESADRPLPMFLICLSNHTTWDYVYAESTPAMMDVLARWAPVLETAAITDLLGNLEEDRPRDTGFAALLRRRLAG